MQRQDEQMSQSVLRELKKLIEDADNAVYTKPVSVRLITKLIRVITELSVKGGSSDGLGA